MVSALLAMSFGCFWLPFAAFGLVAGRGVGRLLSIDTNGHEASSGPGNAASISSEAATAASASIMACR